MDRRNALGRLLVAYGAVIVTIGGYKWYEIARAPDLDFLEYNRELIATLAETIIPSTDTPGAKECQVEEFIIIMIKHCTDRKTQNKFISGLASLQQYSVEKYRALYQNCPTAHQIEILTRFEKKTGQSKGLIGKIESRYFGASFFTTLKKYTVEGYCTSKPGATMGLAYSAVPGKYVGCTALIPGQTAWATR